MKQSITQYDLLTLDDFEQVYESYRDHMLLKNFYKDTVKTYLIHRVTNGARSE